MSCDGNPSWIFCSTQGAWISANSSGANSSSEVEIRCRGFGKDSFSFVRSIGEKERRWCKCTEVGVFGGVLGGDVDTLPLIVADVDVSIEMREVSVVGGTFWGACIVGSAAGIDERFDWGISVDIRDTRFCIVLIVSFI